MEVGPSGRDEETVAHKKAGHADPLQHAFQLQVGSKDLKLQRKSRLKCIGHYLFPPSLSLSLHEMVTKTALKRYNCEIVLQFKIYVFYFDIF